MRLLVRLQLVLVVPAILAAQSAPPATDIYLAPIRLSNGRPVVGEPVNITHRRGYDNQPSFTPDGQAILYTSIREDAQADIYRYDLRTRQTTRVTATPESEYSPTVMPGGNRFSVVRVERDSTQRLWSFALDGTSPEVVFDAIKPVGYHVWIDDHTAALFVLGRPSTLQLADTRAQIGHVVAKDVGRSLQRVPGERGVSFLQREPDSSWSLRVLDLDRSSGDDWVFVVLAKMLPRSDYVAWLPNGTALAAQDSKLFVLDTADNRTWRSVADLAPSGLRGISRLAVSADGAMLAIVAADP